MLEAAEAGHERLVRQMLDQGADDFNGAMTCTALNNHLNIVELMIEKGANLFNAIMVHAAANGHLDVVELMQDRMTRRRN